MVAIEESTSMLWARVIRGMSSRAKAVMRRAASCRAMAGVSRGRRSPTSAAPSRTRERIVVEARGAARAGFDQHLDPCLRERLHCIGNQRDAALAGPGLLGDGDNQGSTFAARSMPSLLSPRGGRRIRPTRANPHGLMDA